MSTFYKQTKHPETNEWDFATWIDDYYGRHRYGVMFPSGEVFNPEKIKLETREAEPKTDVNKLNFIEQKKEGGRVLVSFIDKQKVFDSMNTEQRALFTGVLESSYYTQEKALADQAEQACAEIIKRAGDTADYKERSGLLSAYDIVSKYK